MAFELVGAADLIPPGCMMQADLSNGRRVAVCNVGGELHAIDNDCPHQQGPLAQGALHGKMVVCPWHAWEFDCTTGENDYDPRVKVAKFAVKVEDGQILVDAE